MTKLKFQNPIFRKGMMQTIRRGYKNPTEGYITITDGNDEEIGLGYICTSYMWQFKNIPIEEIRLSHDPECQTREGLLKAMKKFYPDFKESDFVTIIFFISFS